MEKFDYTKDKKLMRMFDKLPPEKFEENIGGEVFDVDKHVPKKSGITNHHPHSPKSWKNKLESEDEHIRKIG